MRTVLVTGGLGYIGSHTVVELQQKDYEVVIADNLSNSNEKVLDSIEKITGVKPHFIKVDLSLADQCAKVFELFPEIEGVINFAAFKAVGESCDKPVEYYRNNLNIILNLLEQMIARGIEYFVQSSSCTVYGEPETLPVREDSPIQRATSPYGNTKQMAEDILRFASDTGKVKAMALRYFNPIGAHESALIGELPNGVPNNLMPYITQTAAGIRERLTVFGNDYPTPDGTCIRDFIHVVDLAKAHVVAMDRFFEHGNKAAFEYFNIGTGRGYSVLEVIRSFEKTTGVKLNYVFGPKRQGDIIRIWADTALASEELKWKAEKSLDQMTCSAWKWQLHLKG